nr:MAG TPA: hypothetical protein [Bacteriophage sp.]
MRDGGLAPLPSACRLGASAPGSRPPRSELRAVGCFVLTKQLVQF